MAPAFALSTGLLSARVTRASRCARRGKGPRMDISVGSIVTEGVALATLAVGAVYLAKAVQAREAAEFGDAEGIPPTVPSATATPPASERNEGILGLMGGSRSEPRAASFASNSARMSAPPPPIAPVFPDLATAARERRTEEIAWAFAALFDLGAVSAAIVDADGAVLRAEGALIQADAEMSGVAERFSRLSEREVLDVTSNAQFPFLEDTVRSVACYPVGEAGAVLIVASADCGFFGTMELRVADAVVTRLANFFGVTAELEHGR